MALSKDDVRGIAEYARIALEGDELEQMTAYLNDAVDMLAPVLEYDLDVARALVQRVCDIGDRTSVQTLFCLDKMLELDHGDTSCFKKLNAGF